jgi:hypothetical protein
MKSVQRWIVFGALLFSFLALPGAANATTADEIFSHCRWVRDTQLSDQTVTKPEDFDSGECWEFFGALQNYSRLSGADGKPLLDICAPAESRLTQFIKIFLLHVDQHPEQGHRDAAIVALAALRQAFPCKPK